MKKAIIIIGNLPPKVNSQEYRTLWLNFLTSGYGGGWHTEDHDEIIVLEEQTRMQIRACLEHVRSEQPDFCIVSFLGHGACNFGQTEIQVNSNQEIMTAQELIDISTKQITIIDCCRNVVDYRINPIRIDEDNDRCNRGRRFYNACINQCPPQQVVLYGCNVGESALGTPLGGLFTNTLIQVATDPVFRNECCINIVEAGNQATTLTEWEARVHHNVRDQHPQVCYEPNIQHYLPWAVGHNLLL